ncbi:complement factor H-like isoform X2 [Acanthopagrus latus]|uniref:complement factor H-like isoform X2 n=1 Tax=Acanthopagrus latus TaxID=8177 RepID=UPI00187CAA7A|nr:complement factor H-like isoform X2 [Acanthopagrus latus]
MCNRYLGFLLLIWCPGELHAQSATQSCSAPSLDGGKFSLKRETYAHGTYVTYSCDLGRKPAVEGWWARSTCQNGTWSPQPRCIRSADACDAPPKIPHAVIVDHRHQELFAADTHLQYECEDGYTAEGAGTDKTIVCIAGTWTEGPTCSSAATPGAGHGGSTEGATGGSGTQPAGRGTTPSTGHGGGSSDSSLQPAGGGSSTTSDSNGSDSRPSFLPINNCGRYPDVPYAAVEAGQMNLRYRCDEYHTLVGLDTVVCHSDRSWSKLPDCKEKSCVLNPARYPLLQLSGLQHLTGAWKRFDCIWSGYYTYVMCLNGEITAGRCCNYSGRCL